MELAVADIHGHHRRRPPLEQAVGEPAGGRTGVEHAAPDDLDRETVEASMELVPAPAHVTRRGPEHRDGVADGDQPGRLRRRCSADRHPTGEDRRPGLFAARDQAPADQLGIEAPTPRGDHEAP